MRETCFAFAIVLWCFVGAGPAWSAEAPAPQGAEPVAFQTNQERIGTLRLGLAEKEARAAVSCAPFLGKESYEGATGEFVQMWNFKGCGVVLKMKSERKGGSKTVASISVSAPSTLATSLGIHVGSQESEVAAAYGKYKDKEPNPMEEKTFVAGSIFDGLIFNFKDGLVSGMFLGAAAE